jgi:CBS domain containing-hemolysin-like protein
MQAARTHMAVSTSTADRRPSPSDILEEIVGEITDEYDVERPPVEWISPDQARVSARLPVDDLGELFAVELDETEVETVAGLLAHALGRVPIPGASAAVGNLTLEAEGTTGRRNRIDTVLVTRQAPPASDRREERQTADA